MVRRFECRMNSRMNDAQHGSAGSIDRECVGKEYVSWSESKYSQPSYNAAFL